MAVLRVALVAVLACCALPSCSGSASDEHVTISATPASELYDQPFVTTVTGLSPTQTITLRLVSTDAHAAVWTSSARFRANAAGIVSTRQAPLGGGSYSGADPMGLTETLTPGRLGASFDPPTRWTMTESVVVGGRSRASVTVTRRQPAALGLRHVAVRPPATGIYGDLYLPRATPAEPAAAVIVIGGSEGGNHPYQAQILAAHGFPALALAYFAEPGLPARLQDIPLEYFAKAVRFLERQPGVDPRHVELWGTSRGSEAALLTASDFPALVDGVIGSVPGAEAYPGPFTHVAAWTLGGRPVPTASIEDFDTADPNAPAAIPVERIRGPLLLVCGGADTVWDSCANCAAIGQRLRTHHGRRAPTVLQYPDAGHFVGRLVPYLPTTASTGTTAGGVVLNAGGTFEADQAGRAAAWPHVLSLLRSL